MSQNQDPNRRGTPILIAICACAFSGFGFIERLEAQTPNELRAADGAMYDGMGKTVATSQDWIVVGTPMDDTTGGTNAGSAYLFQSVNSVWVERQKLTAADGQTDDRFGSSVAIDGNLIIIGAMGSDVRDTNSGAAYVFRKSGATWVQEAKLVPSDGARLDYFGNSVSISGSTVLVGAYNDGNMGSIPGHGSAYVYRHNGSTWVEERKLLASDSTTGDTFGFSVSLSGEKALIGAYQDQDNGALSGSAYVFRRVGTTWSQERKLVPSDGASYTAFGFSVSLAGNVALIGAYQDDTRGTNLGSAYVFRFTGSTWVQEVELFGSNSDTNDRFGFTVLTGVKSTGVEVALVSAPNAGRSYSNQSDGLGSVYVFEKSGTSWVEQTELRPDDLTPYDSFGESLGQFRDTVVVGAPGHGHITYQAGAVFAYNDCCNGTNQNECATLPNGAACTDDGNECTSDYCSSGACIHPAKANGTACTADSNSCTNDVCTSGVCTHPLKPAGSACGSSSSGLCDNPDTCSASGVCQANNLPNGSACADDGNDCTTDYCSSGACIHPAKANGTACAADSNSCTNDVCTSGVCTHPLKPAGSACGSSSSGLCDNPDTCSASGVCQANNLPNNTACADDGNDCTSDYCSSGVCIHPAKANGTVCTADSNSCTNDVCTSGVCTHPLKPAGSACGSSSSGLCDNPDTCSASGVCQANNLPNGSACADDGNTCTSDYCSSGACIHPAKANGTACAADSNSCTNDVCTSGVCTHPLKPAGSACGSSSSGLCDNPDTCSASGVCQANNLPNGSACADDGNECTNDYCSAGSCIHPIRPNGSACDDGNICTDADTCISGTCRSGVAFTCDDSDACTIDSCSPTGGCVSVPITCPLGQVCRNGTCSLPVAICGDGLCDASEDDCTCPEDCRATECGNGICEPFDGETCRTCPQDCNGRLTGPANKQFCCGDTNKSPDSACGALACNARGWVCESEPLPCR